MSFVKVSADKLFFFFFLGVAHVVKGWSHVTQTTYSLDTTAGCRDAKSNLIQLKGGERTAEGEKKKTVKASDTDTVEYKIREKWT